MQWSFNPVGGYLFTVVVAAVLLGLAALRPTQPVSHGRRVLLAVLRVGAILMLLLAMLRPELVWRRIDTLRAELLVLVDSSRSMTVEDSLGDRSRWEAAVELLDQSSAPLEKLGQQCDVRFFTFDRTVRPLAELRRLSYEKPEGEATALGQSLAELLENQPSERLLGVLLLSDGAARAEPGADIAPQVVARRYATEGVPIFPFTFGTPAGGQQADVAIEDLVASESVFANTPTSVSGRLRVRGYANQTLTVQLLWEQEEGKLEAVDAMQVPVGPAGGSFPVSLEYTPKLLGERKVQLRVEPQEGETLTGNNSQTTYVTVREGGVKVLYLAGANRIGGGPGIEQRFIRASLASSPDIVVTRRLVDYQPPRINLLSELRQGKYDVFLLDDLDAEALDRDSWNAIADSVNAGAGLIMIGGYHSFGPGGHARGPLSFVLPVTPSRLERQRFDEPLRTDVHLQGPVKLKPTTAGLRNPILRITADPAAAWRDMPPLDGVNRLERRSLKPNAQVLAVADAPGNYPLLVAGQPGSGRVLAFAGDSTWKWRMGGHGEEHRRFWRQTILWLAQQDDSKRNLVWVDLSARRIARGATLEYTAGANPPDEQAAAPISLNVTLTKPDGTTAPLSPTAREEQYEGVIREIDQAGEYLVTVTGTQAGSELGAASARFMVPDNDLELDQPGAEPSVMAQLAQITADAGGRLMAPEELPELFAELAARDPRVQEEVVARLTFWDKWPFFLLFVSLLGVEWFLRKRWGLV